MSAVTIYKDTDAGQPLARHTEFEAIRRALAEIDIGFERWQATQPLKPDDGQEAVLAAYKDSIAQLNAKYGFKTVDVIALTPAAPNIEAARAKFLAEHTHDDFEIRFFVDGSGLFYIRKNGKVYMTLCEKGDLITLPAHTTHWFDMGPKPFIKAIRFFRIAEGWVGKFTGDTIADRFPKYENA
ncbi:MAG: AraC family ligand binding domain-containing protein [Pseudomonadota bacterium]